ncbi:FeoB-associated Cys-rich membrane protein [Hufsiella ginkgonis]|uniref:FeoB-associated Cys-rich membrane protein n=1 Tax=Hufsiella ginkgonis TaxID=2695274 RepID=A0A7K1Y2J5_9SPHI|nr:FeoB-associated Cys-rich membrane protein [Hufsiella ginkgonis]MXV17504.1 FeoB-associated Cys-rich membrane protein [Hufsiella ginkgonis]
MNYQLIIVFLIFAAALFYLGRMIVKSLKPSGKGCGGNCKCGVDFSGIETPER